MICHVVLTTDALSRCTNHWNSFFTDLSYQATHQFLQQPFDRTTNVNCHKRGTTSLPLHDSHVDVMRINTSEMLFCWYSYCTISTFEHKSYSEDFCWKAKVWLATLNFKRCFFLQARTRCPRQLWHTWCGTVTQELRVLQYVQFQKLFCPISSCPVLQRYNHHIWSQNNFMWGGIKIKSLNLQLLATAGADSRAKTKGVKMSYRQFLLYNKHWDPAMESQWKVIPQSKISWWGTQQTYSHCRIGQTSQKRNACRNGWNHARL